MVPVKRVYNAASGDQWRIIWVFVKFKLSWQFKQICLILLPKFVKIKNLLNMYIKFLNLNILCYPEMT